MEGGGSLPVLCRDLIRALRIPHFCGIIVERLKDWSLRSSAASEIGGLESLVVGTAGLLACNDVIIRVDSDSSLFRFGVIGLRATLPFSALVPS